jgi:NAD(P)-dependent dehydrogenase (short-subunit alcohol dehydrogenase family)
MGDQQVTGPVTIVTGASGGLGRATCRALAERGHTVVPVGRDRGRLAATADLVAALRATAPLTLELDVRSEPDAVHMAEATLAAFGRIDGLVTCAGIAGPVHGGAVPRPLARTTMADWTEVVETNLTGVFLSNRAVLHAMEAQGTGDILNVVSEPAGRAGRPYAAAYSASKRAVAAFSTGLATEARPMGIRVQHLSPAVIDTPMAHNARLPRPWLRPGDVAEVIAGMLALSRDCRMDRAVLTPLAAPPPVFIGAGA